MFVQRLLIMFTWGGVFGPWKGYFSSHTQNWTYTVPTWIVGSATILCLGVFGEATIQSECTIQWREDESSGGRPNQYNCADRESNRRHPDYGLDAISTRPCFHDKNLSHSTSLSLCLHIVPSSYWPRCTVMVVFR